MKVQIGETTLVGPTRAPFDHDHVLPLSHLDNDPNLRVTFRYLRAYSAAAATADPFHVITTALASALVPFYQFAGSLRPRLSDNRLELHCSAAGAAVPVVVATAACTLASVGYLDESSSSSADGRFLESLVPDPDPEAEGLARPCVLQITRFACGGYALGAAIHHALCDGLGATLFFNVMAELARGGSGTSVEPVWDRDVLLAARDPPRGDGAVSEFLSVKSGARPYEQAIGPTVRECFRVSDECLERFKKALFDKSGLKFTTFEALGAFIWRAKVKASKVPGDKTVKYAYSLNIRRIVKPELPRGYWGNGCVPIYVSLTAGDLVRSPIWETAELIKKSKVNATDDYARSFVDFQAAHYGEGIGAGDEVSGFTDWRHLGHSTVDFGWGGPATVVPLSRKLLGGLEPCFFLPYLSGGGGGVDKVMDKDGFKVSVTLRECAVAEFKAEMERFCAGDFGL